MISLVRSLDKNFCHCPYGAAGQEVGYSCPGTCLDYVYEKLGCQFAFAFEIYTDKSDWADLESRWREKEQEAGSAAAKWFCRKRNSVSGCGLEVQMGTQLGLKDFVVFRLTPSKRLLGGGSRNATKLYGELGGQTNGQRRCSLY